MSFGRVEIKTRLLKMAFLDDEQNQSDIIKGIGISSYQWGGYFNPIIPCFENIPHTPNTHRHHLLQKTIQVTEQYVRLHHQAHMALMGNNSQL